MNKARCVHPGCFWAACDGSNYCCKVHNFALRDPSVQPVADSDVTEAYLEELKRGFDE